VRKFALTIFTVLIAASFLAACAGDDSNAPAKAVESYLSALVAKDADRLSTLVCGDWEEEALIELDSFQAVTPRLDSAACTQTGSDGDMALVNCTGKIIATYNDEDQELDLSVRTYQVVQQGGDWLICGTR
jgi:predicted small secreted protein